MTDQNRSLNAVAELEAGEEALGATEGCLERGLLRSALSRAYFAAFHAARALLFLKGLEPRSHRDARHLLSLHLVRTGELDPTVDRVFAYMEKDREDADYAPAASFSPEQARERIEAARSLLEEARRRVAAAVGG